MDNTRLLLKSYFSRLEGLKGEIKFLHRFCSAERAIQILETNSIYLPSPKQLNDSFEFHAKIKQIFDERERREILDIVAKTRFHFNEAQLNQTSNRRDEMAKTEFFTYFASIELEGILGYLYEFSGVICLTTHHDDPLLWAHYADAHRGVCLVFNRLFEPCTLIDNALPVLYSDELVELDFLEYLKQSDLFTESIYKVFGTKYSKWAHEKEWRVIHPATRPLTEEERNISFHPSNLCKIILGDRISVEHRNEIRKIVSQRDSAFIVVQAKLRDDAYGLQYKIIPDNFKYQDASDWYKISEEPNKEFPSLLRTIYNSPDRLKELHGPVEEQSDEIISTCKKHLGY